MYMKHNIFCMHLLGMYTLGKNSSILIKILYQFLRLVCFLFFAVTIALCLLDVYYREDYVFIDVASNFLNSGIFMACVVRIIYFYTFSHKTQDIILSMNEVFRKQSQTGFEEKNTDWNEKLSTTFFIGWSITAFFTGQFFTVLPLILIKLIGKTLPIPAWYPYDWQKNLNYSLTIMTQSIVQFLMGFAYSNSDLFFICTIILTTGQFKILGWEFKNIFQTALIRSGLSKNEVEKFNHFFRTIDNKEHKREFQILSSEKFQLCLQQSLVDCIGRHQVLLKFCDKIQNFFSMFLLHAIFFHMFVIVFVAFALVVAKDFTKCVVFTDYLVTALFDLYLTTYFAQKLSDQSSYLLDDLYETPWYLSKNKKFRSTFMMVQRRTKKYFETRAGNYIVFNLNLFIVTCKTAASYFAVLRQVTEDD